MSHPYNGRRQIAKAVVSRPLHGRNADPRCTCPRRLFRSRCEIGSQRRAQRAKRTGFLMADAPHNVPDQARLAGTPNWRCCGRQMRPACATLPSLPGPCPFSQVLLKKMIFPAGSGTSNLECPSGTAHMSRFCPMGHQFVQFMVQTRFQVPGSIWFGPTLRFRETPNCSLKNSRQKKSTPLPACANTGSEL